MKISLLNYEEYVMDFLEDNLGDAEKIAFLSFLQENPAIQKEIEQTNDPELRLQGSQTVLFPHIELLKKKTLDQITLGEQRLMCKQYLANECSAVERAYVERLLHFYPSFQQVLEKEKNDPPVATNKPSNWSWWFWRIWGTGGSIAALVLGILYTKRQFTETTVSPIRIVEAPTPLQARPTAYPKKTITNAIIVENNTLSEPVFVPKPIELDILLPRLDIAAASLLQEKQNRQLHVLEFDNERKALKSFIKIIGFSIKKQTNE